MLLACSARAHACVRWPHARPHADLRALSLRYQALGAPRAFSAASLEPSASALEPSPNSYSLLPVMSRIIRCANIGAGTVSGVPAGTTRPPHARAWQCAVHARLRDIAELVVRVGRVGIFALDSPAEAKRRCAHMSVCTRVGAREGGQGGPAKHLS